MITPSFSLTATERVLPRLALDFTTASLDPRVTFARTGDTATVTNSSGYIVGINANLPRFDYDPVTLVCKGLLIEEARTNLCLQSQAFNTTWGAFRVGISANSVTSPDGTVNADTMTEDTTNNTRGVQQDISLAIASYAQTLYVKAGTGRYISVALAPTDGTGYAVATFDLTGVAVTKTATSGAGVAYVNSSITSVGNGWYKLILLSSVTAAKLFYFGVYPNSTGTPTYTIYGRESVVGTGKTFYLWGAQLEAGAFATSYIPTEATAVARSADIATMTGTNFSSWFTSSQGSFVAEVSQNGLVTGTDVQAAITVDNGTPNNRLWIYARTASDFATYIASVNAATIVNIPSLSTIAVNTIYKHAISYKLNNFVYSLNGVENGVDTAGNLPVSINQMRIGSRIGGLAYLSGYVRKIFYYPQSLTNAELLAFSK